MQQLKQYKNRLTEFITTYITQKAKEYEEYSFSKDFTEKLLPFTISGKLIRGSLFLAYSEVFLGEEITNQSLSKAAGVELLHSGFLIQDDIMDEDTLRRGKPSIHVQYKNESLAICLSDICFFFSFDLIKDHSSVLVDTMIRTGLGQMNDVNPISLSKKEILQTYEAKTAYYTFYLPMALTYSSFNEKVPPFLLPISKSLGILFQISDDILGFKGDSAITGKNTGSDIEHRRHTLYITKLLSLCTDEEKEKVLTLYSKKVLVEKEVQDIISLCETYKVIDLIEKDMLDELRSLNTYVDSLDLKETQKIFFKSLASYIVSRCS